MNHAEKVGRNQVLINVSGGASDDFVSMRPETIVCGPLRAEGKDGLPERLAGTELWRTFPVRRRRGKSPTPKAIWFSGADGAVSPSAVVGDCAIVVADQSWDRSRRESRLPGYGARHRRW